MTIFHFQDYKKFILQHLENMPRKGYGQFRKISEHLGVSSVLITQIFRGERDLSPEQAFDLSIYLGLSDLEGRYFNAMVLRDRAGSRQLRNHYAKEMVVLRASSEDLKNRVPKDRLLTDEAKTLFYSSWHYSAIRMLTAIPGFQNADDIAERLRLPRTRISQAIDFLVLHGLCTKDDHGQIHMGAALTHLESSSPMISRHHSNWRMKALQSLENAASDELFYTAPMSLSEELRLEVRDKLVEFISETLKKVKDSPSETVFCLNIDWFDFSRPR